MGRFGPVRRISLSDVVFEDQMGAGLSGSVAEARQSAAAGNCRNCAFRCSKSTGLVMNSAAAARHLHTRSPSSPADAAGRCLISASSCSPSMPGMLMSESTAISEGWISPASRSKGLGQDHRCLDKHDDATADRPVGDAERLDLAVGCWIAVQERGIGSWAYITLGLTR
jgi:hypothetical protein